MTSSRVVLVLAFLMGTVTVGQPTARDSAAAIEFFEKEVRPLLVDKCQACHGATKQEGGLRLTARDAVIKGGETGPAVVSGKPESSLLIRAIGYLDELKMPPKAKLPDKDVAKLKRWVKLGLPWPATKTSSGSQASVFEATEEQRRWWAYQPVRDRTPPVVQNASWPRSELDCFVLAKLEARGLLPAEAADRRTWLRRATFDLTGLPPTPEEVNTFLADRSETAHAKVVDRLLASPAYGQRWGRHWLDVVRYADYHDHNPKARVASCETTEAWRYRDWVIDSLNADLPYDQFIVHQIAGDLLPNPTGDEIYPEGLVATTFLSNGVWDRGDADKEKIVSDMADDQIDTIGKAFLGLTLGCSRCHDHKFDPITHEDYYALAGIFYSSHILEELGVKGGEYTMNRVPLVPRAVVEKRQEQLRRLDAIKAKLTALEKKARQSTADDRKRLELVAKRDELQSELLPEPPLAMAIQEGGTPGGLFPAIQDVPVHIRGSYTRLGKVIPRRLPLFFAGDMQPRIDVGSGRRELAEWVASTENTLAARVIVNRIWQWHFGAGLVRTANNFGLLSQPPTHPDLLDWLACRFVEEGWSLKQLHRRIMLSATYRQTSAVSRERLAADPDNRWLARFTARRLEAEAIRDAMLSAAGRLNRSMGGPAGDDLTIARRSVYVQTARWNRSNFAMMFDAANPDASTERRVVSTVAPQSLFLLNHGFVLEQADQVARRLAHQAPDEAARIRLAYQVLFGRPPSREETEIARGLLAEENTESAETAWADLAHVLLCSNEFVYLD